MRLLLLAATMLAQPALAATEPSPGKTDPHVCDIDYNPDDVVDVKARYGDNVAIKLGATETILDVPLSADAQFIKASTLGPQNIFYLKAADKRGFPMPTQPFTIRTRLADGTTRDYALQWTATGLRGESAGDMDKQPAPPPAIVTAAAGKVRADELPKPKAEPNYCYIVRFQYPADVKKQQADARLAKRKKDQEDAAEIALHQEENNRHHNVHYLAQGDGSIAPTEIYDDGYTTTLHFPGNLRVPTIFRESR